MLACLRPFPCLVHCFDKCEYLGMYWQESLDKYQILVLSSVRIKWPCIVIGMISTWFTIHYQVSVSVILIQISISASLVIRNHRSCDAPSLLWGTHIGMRHPHCYEAPSLVWGTLIVMRHPHWYEAPSLLWSSLIQCCEAPIVVRQSQYCEAASMLLGNFNCEAAMLLWGSLLVFSWLHWGSFTNEIHPHTLKVASLMRAALLRLLHWY